MVRVITFNLAVVVTLLLGAEAGPCRPTRTAVTSVTETTSTLAADTSATLIASTTVTTLADTATVTLEDTTTTTEEKPTTTTAAAVCVETQLFVNPNFDDSTSDDITPWTSNAYVTQSQPQSGKNALSAIFSNGEPDYYIKQTLQNLNGDYEFSYYYRVVSVSSGADYTCNIQLTVGQLSSYGEMYDSVGGWRSGSVKFSTSDDTIAQAELQFGLSCYGEFTGIEVDIDTLAFTRVCSA
ncbi:uncharacterized protein B0J16DRAFT_293072 [Fusarium flagelliforme]|uniref:uncharacterized protein n=1 Tax=Fusarium flagelliforme TaxID=2675880 RepID=UPI001E8DAD3F|nr:uncharacterized protein B0J16DRAFT_293072 [Fusarium flagelliforme]KAH7175115.1 hypothetical protein B0J16DRAFT_293072 [Fusarium flagelliforme]